MLQYAFKIDDVSYPNVKVGSIKRSFQIADGPNAGRAEDGGMIRDLIGTYYNYTIELLTYNFSQQDYDELYDVISKPVAYHTITVPYGRNGYYQFKAYITSGEDELVDTQGEFNRWAGLSLQFIAMKPFRLPDNEVN